MRLCNFGDGLGAATAGPALDYERDTHHRSEVPNKFTNEDIAPTAGTRMRNHGDRGLRVLGLSADAGRQNRNGSKCRNQGYAFLSHLSLLPEILRRFTGMGRTLLHS